MPAPDPRPAAPPPPPPRRVRARETPGAPPAASVSGSQTRASLVDRPPAAAASPPAACGTPPHPASRGRPPSEA
eukprot:5998016-Prymnesium_polylepis.1